MAVDLQTHAVVGEGGGCMGRGWLHGEGVAAWEGGGSAFAGVQADGSGLQTAADVELNGQGIGG
jgi:hypothetical protein